MFGTIGIPSPAETTRMTRLPGLCGLTGTSKSAALIGELDERTSIEKVVVPGVHLFS
jgi:hypothetical protein